METATNQNTSDCFDANTVPDAGLDNLGLNTDLQQVLARDCSSLVDRPAALRCGDPPVLATWNGCYGAKCKKNADVFVCMIPYFLIDAAQPSRSRCRGTRRSRCSSDNQR
jgi:hypothetical protein